MPPADRFVAVCRDPYSEEVLARGDRSAYGILQRAGFVPVVRVHETYHRAPANLTPGEEDRLATGAVARLRSAGYRVVCDQDFDTDARPTSYPPPGAVVASLAERLRAAATTDEAAEALTEVTAAHDGVLAALGDVLAATAAFHEGLGGPADPHLARRLRYLAAEYLHLIHADLGDVRDALADRHTAHPGRSTCTEQVRATERERSAVCACPPPPRTTPAPPPPPVTAALRR
ncbi:hypothetical protein ACFU99_12030 [Streptomyces sp. NPDC057654]|uniref:hypothetical protein n=1 Tax=Streptomyces sp. NPDC057654 TaxID=3346196 RepID=UPI00368716A7